MSDVSRYLPLSQRPKRDESGVSGDWSAAFAAVLRAIAGQVRDSAGTTHDAGLRAVAGPLVWRLSTTRLGRVSAGLSKRAASSGAERPATELAAELEAIALDARQTRIPELSAAVVAALDTAAVTGMPVAVDPIALGAVAIARALSAPLPIRAVLGGTTLVALDGDWQVGRGWSVVHAPGAEIAAFLFGRAGVPADAANTMEGGTTKEQDMAGSKDGGFDLGGLEGVVGNLFGGKHFDIKALEPMWAQIQPFLRGLDSDEIVDKIGSWAKELELPIVKHIPDDVITKIQNGVRVPLANLIQR
ncbi:hypothetical protein ABIE21_000368 [Conyzicola nivalis]|uniref:Uncharacterized protein n=1 Tax=Conyzicola nivalis TaxID=1477021 RepID=A0ABV2QJ31_9MICO